MLKQDYFRKNQKLSILLWERVQQNAPMVPMRTMRATKAPTAMPMITATGKDSAENNQREADGVFYTLQTLQLRDTLAHKDTQTTDQVLSNQLQEDTPLIRKALKEREIYLQYIFQPSRRRKFCLSVRLCVPFIEFNNCQFSHLGWRQRSLRAFILDRVHIHVCKDVAPAQGGTHTCI